jgi:ClpP class serine protease
VQRSGFLDAESGLRSYESILSDVEMALQDPEVNSLLFDIDSPGGEAAGAFDAADRLFEMRGAKPMVSVVNALSASAAYLLASATDRIVIPRTGFAGSIGVVMAHVDTSAQLEQEGLNVSLIFAGAHKVDGNPFEPLPEPVRAEFQTMLNAMFDLFTSTTARNRGAEIGTMIATEARLLMGSFVVEAGLADAEGTFDSEFSRLTSGISGTGGGATLSHNEVITMKDENDTLSLADVETQCAEAQKEGIKIGLERGRIDERQRIGQILDHERADTHRQQAMHLAFTTEISAQDAIAILNAAPQIKAPKPASLTERMAQENIPAIGPDVTEEQSEASGDVGRILGSFKLATGS